MREAIGVDDQPNGVCRPRSSFCQDGGKVPLFPKLLRLLQSSYGRCARAAHTGFHCASASPAPSARSARGRIRRSGAGCIIAISALQRLQGNGGRGANCSYGPSDLVHAGAHGTCWRKGKDSEGQAVLDGKPRALFVTPVLDYAPARARRHARAKAMPAQSAPHFRLVCSLRHPEESFCP